MAIAVPISDISVFASYTSIRTSSECWLIIVASARPPTPPPLIYIINESVALLGSLVNCGTHQIATLNLGGAMNIDNIRRIESVYRLKGRRLFYIFHAVSQSVRAGGNVSWIDRKTKLQLKWIDCHPFLKLLSGYVRLLSSWTSGDFQRETSTQSAQLSEIDVLLGLPRALVHKGVSGRRMWHVHAMAQSMSHPKVDPFWWRAPAIYSLNNLILIKNGPFYLAPHICYS
jgi:hypothetical protein